MPLSKHAKISYAKSAVRLAGYLCLYPVSALAATVLFVSEVIGIVEEFGH